MFNRHILTALMLMVSATALHAAPLPVSDFFKHAQYEDIKISPTGRYLAASVPFDSEKRLAIIDRKNSEVTNVFAFGNNKHVTYFEWVGDERLIMRTAIKLGWFARPAGTGDLFAANVDGKRKKLLIRGKGFFITSLLPDDEDNILVTVLNDSNYPDIYRINLFRDHEENFWGRMTTSRDQREMRSPVRNGRMIADHDGVVRFAVGNLAEGTNVLMYREDNDSEWREVGRFNPADGTMTPMRFHADNRRIWMRSNLKAPTDGLALFDPDSGESKLIFRDDRVDISSLVMARDKKTVIAVYYERDKPALHLIEPEHPDTLTLVGLTNAFPGQAVSISGYTEDGTEGVVLVASDRNPGQFFVFNAEAGSLTPLIDRRSWIDPEQMVSRKPVVIPARDGLELHGYLTAPEEGKTENLPLIVLPHGGPHGPRDRWFFDPEAQFFANRGFAVLQVNFRGSGGYGRNFQYSGYRKWGTEMQDDLTDATLWAVREGIADRSRICIYGASYGGYAAIMGVVKEPDLYQCAVGYVGVYDLPLMFRKGDIPDTVDGQEYLKQALGEDEQDLIARSPAHHVEKIKADLFLVHGEEDIRAHFAHYGVLVDALDEIGKPYKSMVKAKEGHGFYDEDNREELYTEMLAFFDRHIGVGSTQTADISGEVSETTR